MHCPFCGHVETKVNDSRLAAEGRQIRRRRECLSCGERFTTFETAELVMPLVVKSDDSREPFDEQKLRSGLLRALEKRPVSQDSVEEAISRIGHRLRSLGEREVASRFVGELVMEELRHLDEVAYVRFASVYRSFQDVDAFREEIERLRHRRRRDPVAGQLSLLAGEPPVARARRRRQIVKGESQQAQGFRGRVSASPARADGPVDASRRRSRRAREEGFGARGTCPMNGFASAEHAFMARALELAALGRDTTQPNPRVGCVLVRDGLVIGEGWHRRAGEPHAEAFALDTAGERARGATAYVTLEPCNHHGRTPPCTEALIDAGVARVVYRGGRSRSARRWRRRGAPARRRARGGLRPDGRGGTELNLGFFSRLRRGRPWVRLKLAASLDGRTALASGESQWISSEAARLDVQAWRAQSAAILTGIGTVLADDPALTVRVAGAGASHAASRCAWCSTAGCARPPARGC